MNQKTTEAARGTRHFVLAAILCTPLAAAAQVAVEAGNVARSTTPAAASPAVKVPGGPVQMTISMAPVPAAPSIAADARGPNCSGAIRNESSVIVPIGKSQLIPLPEPCLLYTSDAADE